MTILPQRLNNTLPSRRDGCIDMSMAQFDPATAAFELEIGANCPSIEFLVQVLTHQSGILRVQE